MRSLRWLCWPTRVTRTPLAHALVNEDGRTAKKTLCGLDLPAERQIVNMAAGAVARCGECDRKMRLVGSFLQKPTFNSDPTVYHPRFKE
jgi:hypothetical protein